MFNLKENDVAVQILSAEEVAKQNITNVENEIAIVKVKKIGRSVDKNRKGQIGRMKKKSLDSYTKFVEDEMCLIVVPNFVSFEIPPNSNKVGVFW